MFENAPVRGELVHLESSWRSVLDRHDYPDVLRNLMGELSAAAVLLAATLKLQGSLVLQIQGKGPIKLLVVECSGAGELQLRATAKWSGDLVQGSVADVDRERGVCHYSRSQGRQTGLSGYRRTGRQERGRNAGKLYGSFRATGNPAMAGSGWTLRGWHVVAEVARTTGSAGAAMRRMPIRGSAPPCWQIHSSRKSCCMSLRKP